jgi:hypothetical protein
MVDSKRFFCTDLAWTYGVPLVGTATRGDIWFLIEYTGSWGAKAFEESSIPQDVKDHIHAAQHPGVEVRTLLVRQDRTRSYDGLRFFVGQTLPQTPRLYEYQIQNYADLLAMDLSELASGSPGNPEHLRADPLYLVCTNGKRDQCCSIYGPETYRAMKEEAGEARLAVFAYWGTQPIPDHALLPTRTQLWTHHTIRDAPSNPSLSVRRSGTTPLSRPGVS